MSALRMRRKAGPAALAAVTALAVSLPAPATAADKVQLGGGAGIVIDTDTYCTLTTIGPDKTGALIGFTSAHCGGPGALVSAEGARESGVLGTMVAGNDGLDYAVIRFDPAKVQPVSNLPTCVIKYIPLHTPAITMSMTAILADLSAKDRPGAGFVPTPPVPVQPA